MPGHNPKRFVLAAMLAALALRLVWMMLTDNSYEGDALARLATAYDWKNNPRWFPSVDWMPLFPYLFGTAMKVGDAIWSPRILNVLIGTATVFVYYRVVCNEFGVETGKWGAVFLSIFHTHIFICGVTETEALFALLVLLAVLFLQQHFQKGGVGYIVLAALFISLSSLLRFEGWMFTLVLAAWFFVKTRKPLPVFLFLFLSCLAPLWEMYEMYAISGDALWGITFSDKEVKLQYAMQPVTIPQRAFVFYISFHLLLLPLFPAGLAKARSKKVAEYWWIIALLPAFYALVKLMSGTLQPGIRYFSLYAILIAPYGLFYLQELYEKKRIKKGTLGLLIVVPSVISLALITFLYGSYNYLKLPEGYKSSASYAKQNLRDGRLMLDQEKYLIGNGWHVYADLQLLDAADTSSKGVIWRISGKTWLNQKFEQDSFISDLSKRQVSHIVLFNDGELCNYLGFTKEHQTLGKYSFDRVFYDGGYAIYKVDSSAAHNAR